MREKYSRKLQQRIRNHAIANHVVKARSFQLNISGERSPTTLETSKDGEGNENALEVKATIPEKPIKRSRRRVVHSFDDENTKVNSLLNSSSSGRLDDIHARSASSARAEAATLAENICDSTDIAADAIPFSYRPKTKSKRKRLFEVVNEVDAPVSEDFIYRPKPKKRDKVILKNN